MAYLWGRMHGRRRARQAVRAHVRTQAALRRRRDAELAGPAGGGPLVGGPELAGGAP
jgi:hypothetical protein